MKADLCIIVDYGSHIGEYIRAKLKEQGRNIKWLAEEKLNMTRQNFSRNWLDKAELKPSQVHQLEDVLGPEFFNEFYEKNKNLKPYRLEAGMREELAQTSNGEYTPIDKGSGYSISIEIDPVNFNPDHMKPLSESLKNALEEFQRRIEEDKK